MATHIMFTCPTTISITIIRTPRRIRITADWPPVDSMAVAADIITVGTAGESRSRTDRELPLLLLLPPLPVVVGKFKVVILMVLFFSCLIVLRHAKWCKIVKIAAAAFAATVQWGAFERGKSAAFFILEVASPREEVDLKKEEEDKY